MDPMEIGMIEVSRTFDAPLKLLWQAWTEPEHFKKWYGPQGFTVPTCEIDAQVGGKHFWSMQTPDGSREMFFTGTYTEFVPMERLVFSDAACDAEGNIMEMNGRKMEMEVTVTFTHADGKTTVTVSHMGNEQAGMGWEQAFDKLAAALA